MDLAPQFGLLLEAAHGMDAAHQQHDGAAEVGRDEERGAREARVPVGRSRPRAPVARVELPAERARVGRAAGLAAGHLGDRGPAQHRMAGRDRGARARTGRGRRRARTGRRGRRRRRAPRRCRRAPRPRRARARAADRRRARSRRSSAARSRRPEPRLRPARAGPRPISANDAVERLAGAPLRSPSRGACTRGRCRRPARERRRPPRRRPPRASPAGPPSRRKSSRWAGRPEVCVSSSRSVTRGFGKPGRQRAAGSSSAQRTALGQARGER